MNPLDLLGNFRSYLFLNILFLLVVLSLQCQNKNDSLQHKSYKELNDLSMKAMDNSDSIRLIAYRNYHLKKGKVEQNNLEIARAYYSFISWENLDKDIKYSDSIIGLFVFFSCSENKSLSPSEIAKVVAESFYHGDEATLKKYTTVEGYANLSSIQAMFIEEKGSESNFKIVDEAMDGEFAWVKYSTAYDPKPGVFKLVKEDGQWKVTHNGPRDKGPF